MNKNDYTIKAQMNKKSKIKNIILISILGAIVCAGGVFLVISLINAHYFYAFYYLVAMILGLAIMSIKINTVFNTFVAVDDDYIYMQRWKNDLLPYDIDSKYPFVCDFIPAKTKITKIPINNLDEIIIGTKNYIKRYCKANEKFLDKISTLEKSKAFYKENTIDPMDLFYVSTKDGEFYFMSICNYDIDSMTRILNFLFKTNPEIEVRCNNKQIRRKMATML